MVKTHGWVSVYDATPTCTDCVHVVVDGRMCACDMAIPGFPLNDCKYAEREDDIAD